MVRLKREKPHQYWTERINEIEYALKYTLTGKHNKLLNAIEKMQELMHPSTRVPFVHDAKFKLYHCRLIWHCVLMPWASRALKYADDNGRGKTLFDKPHAVLAATMVSFVRWFIKRALPKDPEADKMRQRVLRLLLLRETYDEKQYTFKHVDGGGKLSDKPHSSLTEPSLAYLLGLGSSEYLRTKDNYSVEQHTKASNQPLGYVTAILCRVNEIQKTNCSDGA